MSDDRRDRDIEALEERVRLLSEDNVRLGDREAMYEFDGDEVAARETRALAALNRDRAAGYAERARKLRAEREPVPAMLPMRVTRRVS